MIIPTDNLAKKSLHDILWTYCGVAIHTVAQIVGSVALARLLGPEAFGLFAIVMIVCGPLRLLGELGLGSALVQKSEVGDDDVSRIFTRLMIAGFVIALGLYAGSGALEVFFHAPGLTGLLHVVAIVFLFYPLATICTSIMSRDLNRKHIQIVAVAGYVIGYIGVGVFGALHGWGVWSLAFGFVTQTLGTTIILVLLSHPRLAWRIDGDVAHFWRFGARATAINALTWLVGTLDNVIVGRVFGPASLGIYSVAYNVVRTPADQLVVTMQNILLPASAKVQSDSQRVGRGYLAALDAIFLSTAPVFAGLAAVSATFIAALYGDRWSNARSVLLPLALAMPLHALNAVSSAVLWGSGNVGKEIRLQVVVVGVFVVVIGGLAQVSLAAVAWGVLIVYAFRASWMVLTVARSLGIAHGRVISSLRTGLFVAPVVGVPLAILDQGMLNIVPQPVFRLCIDIAAGGALWVTGVFLMGKYAFSNELRSALSMLLVKMPRNIREWAMVRQA